MPLLNYTTEVPASRSISEITQMLQDAGASAIMLEYSPDREVTAVTFKIATPNFGEVPYSVPANVPAVILALNAQISDETRKVNQRRNYNRKIPRSLYNNKEQAERIAWRIAKDWLEAQLAIQTVGSAKLEQVLLPFARTPDGSTVYDRFVERGSLALLPAPKQERAADADI